MSEQARERIRIDAPIDRCFATLIDFASYPEWAGDLKEVRVVESDASGRATVVEFRAAAMGRSTTYQLAYDYSAAPGRLSWSLVTGDLPRELDGAYVLSPVDGGSTEVEYELAVDLVYPIPGFVKRRAEGRIIKTALTELKARVEGSPRPVEED
ncbi:MAG: SRPBCC family protein [Acidobacteria bacterium]|nr:SRPBCC family protein [Acidobacteriota bacterium]